MVQTTWSHIIPSHMHTYMPTHTHTYAHMSCIYSWQSRVKWENLAWLNRYAGWGDAVYIWKNNACLIPDAPVQWYFLGQYWKWYTRWMNDLGSNLVVSIHLHQRHWWHQRHLGTPEAPGDTRGTWGDPRHLGTPETPGDNRETWGPTSASGVPSCLWCAQMPLMSPGASGVPRCPWCPQVPLVFPDASGVPRCLWCPQCLWCSQMPLVSPGASGVPRCLWFSQVPLVSPGASGVPKCLCCPQYLWCPQCLWCLWYLQCSMLIKQRIKPFTWTFVELPYYVGVSLWGAYSKFCWRNAQNFWYM